MSSVALTPARRFGVVVAVATLVVMAGACDPTAGKRPPGPEAGPAFTSSSRPATQADVVHSWRPGCPTHWSELAVVTVAYWGYDGERHVGDIVVHNSLAASAQGAFGDLYDSRFQIQRIEPIDVYRGDDDLSMAHNNTSGFNCRRVAGSTSWSQHAHGRAIDINPLQNPWVTRNSVSPPGGKFWTDRTKVVPGMIIDGDPVTTAFGQRGWAWGGRWNSPDYQHMELRG